MSRGAGLEKLVMSCQTDVILTQVKGEVIRLSGGRMIQKCGPVDFMGIYKPTRTLIVFDAKQSSLTHRLETNDTHLPEHQRLQLIRYGECGAIAGILAERLCARELYWLPWNKLLQRKPSYQWEELRPIGSSKYAIRWANVVAAAHATRVISPQEEEFANAMDAACETDSEG